MGGTVTGTFKVIRSLTKRQLNQIADLLGVARSKLRSGTRLVVGAGRKGKRRKTRKSVKTGRRATTRKTRRRRARSA
jgi:hypothetical protein